MARIIRCTITGLKGATGSKPVELAPCTVIIGPNGCGKTTILDAVALALLGYHPTAGRGGAPMKDPADLVQRLAADGLLQVELVVETAAGRRTITRRWEQRVEKDGSIKYGKPVLEVRGGGPVVKGKEAEAEIAHLVGRPAFLDPTAWLSLADGPRRAKLLELLPTTSPWGEAELWSVAAACGISQAQLEAIWDRPDVARRPGTGELARLWAADGEEPLRDWLLRQQAFVAEISREDAERCRGLERAIGELDGDTIDAHHVAELAAAREAAERDRAQARQAFAGPLDQARAERLDLARTAELPADTYTRLDQLRRRLTDAAIDRGAQAAALQARIDLLADEPAWGDPEPGSLLAHRLAVVGAGEQVTEAEGALARAREEEEKAQAAVARTREELAGLTAQLTARVERNGADEAQALQATGQAGEALEAIRAALAGTAWGDVHCPTCLQVVDPSSLLLTLEERWCQAGRRAEEITEAGQQALAELREQHLAATGRATSARQWADRAHQAALTAQDTLARLQREQRTREGELAEATRELDRLRLELEQERSRVTGAVVDLEALRREEQALTDQVRQAEEARGRLAVLDAELARLEQQQRQAEAVATERWEAADRAYVDGQRRLERRQGLARLRADLAVAEDELQASKAASVALGPKGLQGRLLACGLAPLTHTINGCIEGLGLGRFDVRLLDERGGEVCWPGVWVEHDGRTEWRHLESLSGGQSAAVVAAFLAGLAGLAGSPLRLLAVDGLERIDQLRRPDFMAQVAELQAAGRIDQAILMGCPDAMDEVPGWTILDCWDRGAAA